MDPIIEHSYNLNEDYELNNLNMENEALLFAVNSNESSKLDALKQPLSNSLYKSSLMDLEFGNAFTSINSTSTNLAENNSKLQADAQHPTPSSIFGDL